MKRSRPISFWPLMALSVVWAGALVTVLAQHSEGRNPWIPLQVLPAAHGYPVVTDFTWGLAPGAPSGGTSNLRPGDRLLRAGESDLAGVGRIAFLGIAYREIAARGTLALTIERAGQTMVVHAELVPGRSPWRYMHLILLFGLFGLAVLLRAPDARAARLAYLGCLSYSFYLVLSLGGPGVVPVSVWLAALFTSWVLVLPLPLLAVFALMDVSTGRPVQARLWPWLWILLFFPAQLSRMTGWPFPDEFGLAGYRLVQALWLGGMLAAFVWTYVRTGALGRRRLKWVAYGALLGFAPPLAGNLVALLAPDLTWVFEVTLVSVAAIPICVFLSIAQYQLYDIDRLISATTTYALMVFALIAGLLILAPQAAAAASVAVGVSASTGQMLFSLLVAGLAVPAQKMLRQRVDRFFFAERHALEQGIEELLGRLSSCSGAEELFRCTGESLARLLRPECCVIYARAGASFVPVFVRGPAAPPAFAQGSALLRQVERNSMGLVLGPRPGVHAAPTADAVERAALESLGAELLLPITHHGSLVAFICVGQKRSGDVYINTDIALLAAVANKVSSELTHFDAGEVRRQARAMQDSLRRYVPGAVAERLERGGEIEAAAREVTILFVDLRAYTAFSEGRTPAEIFSLVNRYTEAVSAIVRKLGGSIVEFNGDGLMVVFGAPDEHPAKERAAVDAAHEIIGAVRALGGGSPATRMEAGIGIATGEAFVGNIQAVDRVIWGAIGDTTNLAARLQNLSKDLKANIVIDSRTRERAPEATAAYRLHPGTEIRGRRRREHVYALAVPVTGEVVTPARARTPS